MRSRIDDNWRFYPDGESLFFGLINEGYRVDLPHDFSIVQKRDPETKTGASNAFFPGGIGCYTKSLFAPDDWKDKEIILEFEGVYMNATVHFNKQLVKRHIYGYTGFFCDLTPFIKYGCDNEISVNVNNDAIPNSRWYSGLGIYRHVWLETREQSHIASWGVHATTPVVSEQTSEVKVETTLENNSENKKCIRLRSSLLDKSNKEAAYDEKKIEISPNSRLEIQQPLKISPTHLWSIDNPYLYTLKSELICDRVIDEKITNIGIRSISFDAKQGFRLNGRAITSCWKQQPDI